MLTDWSESPESDAQIGTYLCELKAMVRPEVMCVQLTQKKTSMQFKTLDTSLRTIDKDTKQHQTTSYKCAEVDQIVSEKMCIDKVNTDIQQPVLSLDCNWNQIVCRCIIS